jgi:hypothetical protein
MRTQKARRAIYVNNTDLNSLAQSAAVWTFSAVPQPHHVILFREQAGRIAPCATVIAVLHLARDKQVTRERDHP